MKNRTIVTTSTFALGLFSLAQTAHSASLWSSGHGDIGLAYEDGAFDIHFHLSEEAGDPAIVGGVAVPEDEFEIGDIDVFVGHPFVLPGTTSASVLAAIGANAGDSIFLLPDTATPTVPFMGFATEELDAADWSAGTLEFTFSLVSGPGDFAIFDATGIFASTATPDPDVLPLFPEAHAHYNLSFSEAGVYQIEITASGEHVTDGLVSASETLTFTTSIPEPSSALLMGLSGLGLLLRRRRS